jgi:hypothetical protein
MPRRARASAATTTISASAAGLKLPMSSMPAWPIWRSGAIWLPRTRRHWPA